MFVKKVLALGLVFSSVIFVTPVCAAAWEGNGEVSQVASEYEEAESTVIDNENYWVLDSAEDLYWFSDYVNEGNADANAVLEADIVVTSDYGAWEPIAYACEYSGKFDGAGHVISGLTYDGAEYAYLGLFGKTSPDAVICNVSLVDCSFNNSYSSDKNYVGSVVAYNTGTVSACTCTGTISSVYNRESMLGGIVGYNEGYVKKCKNYATVTTNGSSSSGAMVGGVVGINYCEVSECGNCGAVSCLGSYRAGSIVGGIAGANGMWASIADCYNDADITGSGDAVGGITGHSDGTVSNCINYRGGGYYKVTICDVTEYVGGIVGNNMGEVTACVNYADVVGVPTCGYVGGVVGYNGVAVDACRNAGTISGGKYVDDIVGYNSGVVS